ncbi:MAG: hypothetical protein KGQ36_00450 [Rickettsiales bacterium]|nr:hypothetical protein [Rickettsiales bacterium]
MRLLEFINSDNNIEGDGVIGKLCKEIMSHKTYMRGGPNEKIRFETDQQRKQLIKLVEAACLQDKKQESRSFEEGVNITALSHIIDIDSLDEETQAKALFEILTEESRVGLKWFLGVGFKASAKYSDTENFNALEFLTEHSAYVENKSFFKDAAKIIIDVRKNNTYLEESRSGLRKRTVEGKNIPELIDIEKLLIFGIEKDLINIEEFSPSFNRREYETEGFEKTIQNIFKDDTKRIKLLKDYKADIKTLSHEYERAKNRVDNIILNTVPKLEERELPVRATIRRTKPSTIVVDTTTSENKESGISSSFLRRIRKLGTSNIGRAREEEIATKDAVTEFTPLLLGNEEPETPSSSLRRRIKYKKSETSSYEEANEEEEQTASLLKKEKEKEESQSCAIS